MRFSPPILTLIAVAVALAGTGWLRPQQSPPTQISVVLSAGTYDKLVTWAKDRVDADGQQLTVAQAIETLAGN